MKSDRTPAWTRAHDFLNRHFAHSDAPSLSIAACAQHAGVSYVTMWKAVRELKARGTLHGKYRVLPASPERPATFPPSQSPRQRLEQRISQDLLAGRITRNGRLISIKELVARYATSTLTVRRALARILERGDLIAHGRHYSVTNPSVRRDAQIVLIVHTLLSAGDALFALERDFLRGCEQACVNARIRLMLVKVPRDDSSRPGNGDAYREMIPQGPETIGYIHIHPGNVLQSELYRHLLSTRKPVALPANYESISSMKNAQLPARVRVLHAAGPERFGRDAAAYLVARGHHHCAYISPFHGDDWSQTRCRGIQRYFARAGDGYSLSLHAIDKSIASHAYATQGSRDSRGDELLQRVREWARRAPALYRPYADAVGADMPLTVFMHGAIATDIEPLLDKAASDQHVTAWILANDMVGRMALRYCARKGIAVPGRVAIIGFDDDIESSEAGLTSYNFNNSAIASAAVQFIMRPDSAMHRRRSVEIPGSMVRRESG